MVEERSGPAAKLEVTRELNLWSAGDPAALDRAFPHLYDELKRLAQARLRSFPSCLTMEASSLLHDAYLRLGNTGKSGFDSRSDFFLLASSIMRSILLDYVRQKHALKRGQKVNVTLSGFGTPPLSIDLLALDQALTRLEEVNARQAKFVEMKFFGGLTERQIAEETGTSVSTVTRSLQVARAWLRTHMTGPMTPIANASLPRA